MGNLAYFFTGFAKLSGLYPSHLGGAWGGAGSLFHTHCSISYVFVDVCALFLSLSLSPSLSFSLFPWQSFHDLRCA